MKFLSLSFLILFFLAACDTNSGNTERTVVDTDTLEVEKEYEVEKKVREVTIDTVTETETVEKTEQLQPKDTSGGS
ncbi:MAG: hypothetical protein ACLFUB_16885 [Cyclobacteriaceae bacterium]